MAFRYDLAALGAAFAAVLWFIYRYDRGKKRAGRATYFADCMSLFEDCRITERDLDYPLLDGRYRGHTVRLEPVVDHIAFRKLPSFWLKVSVRGELPITGTVDFLVRPQNTEFYSPAAELPVTLPIPPGWPAHALLRTDIRDRSPPVELLTPHMAMFDDAKTKELLVTPRGVRIVYQAHQAERAYYLVLRQAEFGIVRLPPELARRLLEQAIAVYNSLAMLPDHVTHEPTRRSDDNRAGEA